MSLAVVTIIVAGLDAARRRRRCAHRPQAADASQRSGALSALRRPGLPVGLLALLLGFSFCMGQTRYDVRRRLVVDEANAVATSRLRTFAVSEPTGSEMRVLLDAYVESRLIIVRTRSERDIKAAIAESERLQREVWSRAASLAKADPRSIPVDWLLQSLNEMIDLQYVAAGRGAKPYSADGAGRAHHRRGRGDGLGRRQLRHVGG